MDFWGWVRLAAVALFLGVGVSATPAAAVPITIYDDTDSSGDYTAGEEVTGGVGGSGGSSFAWEFDLDASTMDLASTSIDISYALWDNSFEITVNGVVVVPEDPTDPSGFTPAIGTPWLVNSNGLPRLVIRLSVGSITFDGTTDTGTATLTTGLLYALDASLVLPIFVDGQNTIVITNPDGPGPDAVDFSIQGNVGPIVAPEPGTFALALLGLVGLAILGGERPPVSRPPQPPSSPADRS